MPVTYLKPRCYTFQSYLIIFHKTFVLLYITESIAENFAEYTKMLKRLHRWMKASGFPDTWPVNTTFNENKNLLKKNWAAISYVLFEQYGIKEFKAAKILTGEMLSIFKFY